MSVLKSFEVQKACKSNRFTGFCDPNGTVRGGPKAEYDGGMVIQVQSGGRAICEKNRYSGEELTYLVFKRKLEESEPVQ